MVGTPWTLPTVSARKIEASIQEVDEDQTRQALWQSFDAFNGMPAGVTALHATPVPNRRSHEQTPESA